MGSNDSDVATRLAVLEAKLEILVDDFKNYKGSAERHYGAIDKNIAEIFAIIRSMPEKISACRDQLETDMHNDLEKYYASNTRVNVMETELSNKIEKNSARYKWTVAAIVAIAGAIQFGTTMWFMTLQISKLSTGG